MITKLLSLCCCLAITCGQFIPIPKRPVGFAYNNASADSPVHIDFYMGPLCPDTKEAFPTLLQVANYYGPTRVKLTGHEFPLPYHHQSFLVAMGAHAVDMMSRGSQTWVWFNTVYSNLDSLSNTATYMMTTEQVIGKLASMAASMGLDPTLFKKYMAEESVDDATRLGWKYTCTRGISGTPEFFVNDALVGAESTWTLKDWKQVLDPLFSTDRSAEQKKTCPFGEKTCQYLPGKTECCTKGEHCIPNVGCRCYDTLCTLKKSLKVKKTCPTNTKYCEYLPGKVECCTPGEGCIPNVGCRC